MHFFNSPPSCARLVCLAVAALLGAPAQAQSLSADEARAQLAPYYEMLNQPADKDLKALAAQVLAPDWKSYASETDVRGRDAFVAQVVGFGKLIPDLRWEIKDVLVDGQRVVVRSEASGTPAGALFGVQPRGKSFKVMAIDIHSFKGGKAVSTHHVQDWARALRQLSAP